MQTAAKERKPAGMTKADWDFWDHEVVHAAAGQVHLLQQWPAGVTRSRHAIADLAH